MTEPTDRILYMRYIGALSLLAQCGVHVPEDLRESIEAALSDGVQQSQGRLRYRRVINRFDIEVVQ